MRDNWFIALPEKSRVQKSAQMEAYNHADTKTSYLLLGDMVQSTDSSLKCVVGTASDDLDIPRILLAIPRILLADEIPNLEVDMAMAGEVRFCVFRLLPLHSQKQIF